jgi:tetratricopeptide (TPR) repeat protein
MKRCFSRPTLLLLSRRALVVAVMGLAVPLAGAAEKKASLIHWAAKDVRGQAVEVPQAGQASLLLFVRADQPQSLEAIRQANASLKSNPGVQAILVLSGPQDAGALSKVTDSAQWKGSAVIDPDYVAAGQMAVHVWPTTVVVGGNSEQLAHLPGMSKSYGTELDAYLEFATGKADQATLQRRLNTSEVIADSAEQMAGRHLQVAQRLLEKGSVDQASAELTEGLKLQPKSTSLQLAMAQVLLAQGQTQRALQIADDLDGKGVPAWQINLLRGRAMVMLGKWEQARPLLEQAVKLNPEPAPAYYELALVYQHQKDWQRAAETFRVAFEATSTGKGLMSGRPAK